MPRENWDDLRYVLAVADTGSVSGAARLLGVNHATVLRRIAAFEDEAGTEIFDKSPRGYAVPQDKARIIAAAREVDAAVRAVERIMTGSRVALSGTVRVASTDTLSVLVLPRVIAAMRRAAPDLRVEVQSSNAPVDLGRIQADVAVRPTSALPDDLIGERAGDLEFLPYAAADRPVPDAWLGLTGALTRSAPAKWMEAERIVPAASADSFLVLAGLAAAGQGLAILPRIVGRADPRLVAVPGLCPPLAVPIWVASHPDLAEVPRIAQARALLRAELLREMAP